MDAFTDDGSGSSSDTGRGQSEGSADELLAAVIGARYLLLMRRHRRNAARSSGLWPSGVPTGHVISTRVCAASCRIILVLMIRSLCMEKRHFSVAFMCHGLFV